ncbi:response regulator [Leptothoe kymatousa]|uniref:Response regulator n=1 Tax=Leptothoe kymatousa TAU-MAC 1615 TaxID=2364775 RepID=A0ABS5Y6L3_9CYAN|nr:response regulator [Leptothoe kymatousa]MBT9313482.1 response regulator [Leptothoe kymatousa TAU-MAC 1615]
MSTPPIIHSLDQKIQQAKRSLYTGLLAVSTETDTKIPWVFYFLMGQIVWANSRTHPKRRWQRQYVKHSPQLKKHNGAVNHRDIPNYKTVSRLVMHQRFDQEQFSKIVRGCITEVLFDILYTTQVASVETLTYKASPRKGVDFPCIALQQTDMWEQAQQDWQAWQGANLLDCCPNLAPKVVQSDLLQDSTRPDIFKVLNHLADGQQTLRDLAVKADYPLIPLAQSLVPHIRRNLIQLVYVDDFSHHGRLKTSSLDALASGAPPTHLISDEDPGVIYITANLGDGQAMANIFNGSGYRYCAITDPVDALNQLMDYAPKLIFLDLMMPVINGYELCVQIRRIIEFRQVPIVLIANSQSIPDRVRAKFVGATGFLSYPIKASQVLPVAMKHLKAEDAEPVAAGSKV